MREHADEQHRRGQAGALDEATRPEAAPEKLRICENVTAPMRMNSTEPEMATVPMSAFMSARSVNWR